MATRRPQMRTESPTGDARILRDDAGREVVIFTTPSGVRAIVSTAISDATLAKLARSLKRKIRRAELRLAHRLLAGRVDR